MLGNIMDFEIQEVSIQNQTTGSIVLGLVNRSGRLQNYKKAKIIISHGRYNKGATPSSM